MVRRHGCICGERPCPCRCCRVVMDEEAGRMEVGADDQLSLAIGRRGQNVRLASQLTGWYIDILTEERNQSVVRKRHEFVQHALWKVSILMM